MNWLAYEEEALAEGYEVVCGIDEAGRGPLAGPVCAACVVLPKGMVLEGVNDSKKLSEKKRDALYDVIKEQALDYGIAFASEKEIDEINILQATFLAMRRAVEKLQKVQPDIALIDGNKTPGLAIAERCIIKGDGKSANIAAASILAKVTRDRYMLDLAKQYPQYQFEKHKGYGTKLHYEMIEKYGVSDIHRRSFLKKILEK
ncbi:MAG: ribonuclease HII [Clostridia bacterium]|nr:ribonuclease HII [Clostridia bacterium]